MCGGGGVGVLVGRGRVHRYSSVKTRRGGDIPALTNFIIVHLGCLKQGSRDLHLYSTNAKSLKCTPPHAVLLKAHKQLECSGGPCIEYSLLGKSSKVGIGPLVLSYVQTI